jgi:hypothetical protein
VLTDIGAIGPDAQFLTTCAPGKINNLGEVAATQTGAMSIALLYTDGVLYDLNELLDTGTAADWDLFAANDINDRGTIVGQGRFNRALQAYRAVRVDVAPGCKGDRDLSGVVDVAELITAVNIALGSKAVSACTPADANADQHVSIDELIGSVGNALGGCRGVNANRAGAPDA